MQRASIALLSLGALLSSLAAAQDSSYMFEIPAYRHIATTEPLGDYIHATLDVQDGALAAAALSNIGALDVLQVDGTRVTVGVRNNATAGSAPDEQDLADTFVVDFSEPSVQATMQELKLAYGDQPAPTQIEQFVFDYIDDKNYMRSFDLASRVADNRAGDCTEHAVLLAALARASGLPARVVLGVVLLNTGDQALAYGHAWTEVHSGDAWVLTDGTAPSGSDTVDQAYYLPLLVLENEGPGYNMDLARLVNVQPAKVTDIRAAIRHSLSQKADSNE